MASATASRARGPRMAMGLPCGRRVPKGRVRWYPLKVREGSEGSTCERLLRLVPRDVLMDCFPLVKERWLKRAGAWSCSGRLPTGTRDLVSGDPAGLYKALAKVDAHARSRARTGAPGCRWRQTCRSGSSTAWTRGTCSEAPRR